MNGMTIPFPNEFDEPADLEGQDGARKRWEIRSEESAHRGTLAPHARGLSPRSGRRVLQPRRLRRVHGRGVRGVPAAAARARGASRPSSSHDGSTSALLEARAALASFVGARVDDLVFTPNATSALNAVIRSLRIRPEEEILTTKHEYGAILRTLGFIRANVVLVEPEELVASIGIRTRAIVVSHITSPTALVLPVEEICDAARKAGVLTIVDGAHAPGQVPLDLEAIGADVYAGNCHKWLCAPKGSGFLWARPEHQEWIEPLVISWGYHEDADFGERHGWQGTRDPAAYLAVPKAIEVHATFDLDARRSSPTRQSARLARMRSAAAPRRRARRSCARSRCATADPQELWQPAVRGAPRRDSGVRVGGRRRSCASPSARTTTRPTSSGWSERSRSLVRLRAPRSHGVWFCRSPLGSSCCCSGSRTGTDITGTSSTSVPLPGTRHCRTTIRAR